jgi:hypothetical protein
MIRVTFACPEAIAHDANDMMMVLGRGPEDGRNFANASWTDKAGRSYAVASALLGDVWPAQVGRALIRPGWDTRPYVINLAGAERARDALRLADQDTALPDLLAEGRIVAVTGMPGRAALAALGLQEVGSVEF